MSKIVIALGGNALEAKGLEATSENQYKCVMATVEHIVKIIKDGNDVVVTHGNGPQVGRVLLQNEAGKNITPANPMDMCVAATQGMIGYHLQNAIRAELMNNGINKNVCTVLTQVVVDKNDKAFANPTKPVGPFYTKEEAEILEKEKGYKVKEDAGRGYRRVVPSPMPTETVEFNVIKSLIDGGNVVIACGGGGIPVIENGTTLTGVEAVVDKDFASCVLANQLNSDVLFILTEVENVCLNFGKPEQKTLTEVSVSELKQYIAEGHFAPGSMLPKVQAAINFVEGKKGRKAIITSISAAKDALTGKTGTTVIA
ncbi:MAG: carbamate kinase [Oscillospiraceae bacterium]